MNAEGVPKIGSEIHPDDSEQGKEVNPDDYLIESREEINGVERLYDACADLFPGMKREHTENALAQAIETIQNTAHVLTDELINKCEKQWNTNQEGGDYELDEEVPGEIYESYFYLRGDDFSENDIRELMHAGRSGKLEETLLSNIEKEKVGNERMLDNLSEQIEQMEAGVESYFKKTGTLFPSKEKVPIVGLGKYQGMLMTTAEHGSLSVFGGKGRYQPETGAVYIKSEKEDGVSQGEINDTKMHLLVHERLHSLSTTKLSESFDGALKRDHVSGYQVGFLKTEEGNKEPSYGYINEAVTEYFARKISDEVGYSNRLHESYDEEAESLELLLAHLGEDAESTQDLLTQYTSESGLEELRKKVEEKVGPNGLAICNSLFIRPQILEKFLYHSRDSDKSIHGEKLEMDLHIFENTTPPLDPHEVQKDYPFIKIMTHIRDPQTSEWKRVPLE